MIAISAVSPEEASEGVGGSLLSGLMASLRLPERALEALEAVAGAARALAEIRFELTALRKQTEPLAGLVPLTKELKEQVEPMPATVERIAAQAKPLDDLLPALERFEQRVEQRLKATHETIETLECREARLNEHVEELCSGIASLHRTVSALKDDVGRITERLPDPTRGALEKARDVLTGSSASGAEGGS